MNTTTYQDKEKKVKLAIFTAWIIGLSFKIEHHNFPQSQIAQISEDMKCMCNFQILKEKWQRNKGVCE